MKQLLQELKTLRHQIPRNTYRTIRGQILSGNVNAARVGMKRIKKKMEQEAKEDVHDE